MKFIHAADIHLDSPLLNLNRYDGAPVEEFRSATRKAFQNLVELAIEEQVDFVLIAGDLYDGECKDMHTPLAFSRLLRELSRKKIGVHIVQGNHDAQSRVTKALRGELPEGARLFSTARAETVKLDDLKVAIHGQGFPTAAVEEDLSLGYPAPIPHYFNIGLLHSNCGGAPGHDNYAPSTVSLLSAKGYDYWALGHIHHRTNPKEGHPWIVYPGNIQGRNIRETGEKGCVLVSVEDGEVTDVAFRPLDVLRWSRVEVEAGQCATGREVVDAVMAAVCSVVDSVGDRALAARVEVLGSTRAHRDLLVHWRHYDREIREEAARRFPDQVWIEKIRFSTGPALDEKGTGMDEALSGFLHDIDAPELLKQAVEEVRSDREQITGAIPSDPRQPMMLPVFENSVQCRAFIGEVKQLLMARLVDKQEVK